MNRTLFLIVCLLFSVTMWGQEATYPKNGLILHYDFNGNVRDKVQGVYLKSVSSGYHEQGKQLTKDDVSFIESPDGEQGAIKMLTADIPLNLSPDKYPELTVVMRVWIDEKQDAGNPMFFLCQTDDKQVFSPLRKLKADKRFRLTEAVPTDTAAIRLFDIGTGTEKVKTAAIPKESWETVLVSFSAKDSSVTFVCGGEKLTIKPNDDYYHGAYTAMRLFPKTGNGSWYGWLIGDSFDRMNGAVDDLRIYNRLLTDEEISGVFGRDIVTVEQGVGNFFTSEAFTYTVIVVFVFMFVYALFVLIMHPRRLKKITLDSIAREKQNNKSLSEDERNDLALEAYEQTLKKWGYEADKENGDEICLHYVKSGMEAKGIRDSLLKSISYGSSDAEVMEKQNLLIRAYNRMMDRSFNGSPFYIVLIVICLYFMAFKYGDAWNEDSSFLMNVLMAPVHMWPVVLGLLIYVLYSFGPHFMEYKGGEMKVSKPGRALGERPENSTSGAVVATAGALTLASVGMGILHFFGEVLKAVPNSMNYVMKNVRTGATVSTGSLFTVGGIFMLVATIFVLWFLVVILSVVVIVSPFVLAPYKFVRNYVLYY